MSLNMIKSAQHGHVAFHPQPQMLRPPILELGYIYKRSLSNLTCTNPQLTLLQFLNSADSLNSSVEMASGTSDGLILIGSMGKADPVYNQRKTVQGNYTKAMCEGDRSFYVVYDQEGFVAGSKSLVVDSTTEKDLGRPIRSLQGYNKQGLILFPHPNYCGQAALFTADDPNILDQFPQGGEGVSALVVHQGRWALYTETNHRGTRISINGKDSFGPGTCIPYIGDSPNDKVKSVKLL